jgi:O2-independent ubiquinone biosynthesis accessory factor UbiT
LLQLLPPPSLLRWPLGLLPEPLIRLGAARFIDLVLAGPLAAGALDDLEGRRLGLEATDLGQRWIIAVGQRSVVVLPPATPAEAVVCGEVTDLMLLASRLEDADTLFFHRRLRLTGDVELGLLVRNLLDQLPWESLPRPLRSALRSGARLARDAREARRPSTCASGAD